MGRNVLATPWLIKPPAAESRELEGTESAGNSLAATGALIPYGGSRMGAVRTFRYYAALVTRRTETHPNGVSPDVLDRRLYPRRKGAVLLLSAGESPRQIRDLGTIGWWPVTRSSRQAELQATD
jgi:hypothetical protein